MARLHLLDLKSVPGEVTQGEGAAECTLELPEADFLDLTQGKADPMKLFTTGKLKISGNVMASQKLNFLSKIDPSKAIEAVREEGPRGAGGAPAQPAAAAGGGEGRRRTRRSSSRRSRSASPRTRLAAEVRASLTFNVTRPRCLEDVRARR